MSDFNDKLPEDIFGFDNEQQKPVVITPRTVERGMEILKAHKEFVENCQKCRGTGRFQSYSGRSVGPCFACKGKGKFTFKTSTEDRAKARQASHEKKARNADQACEDLKASNPEVYAWLLKNVEKFEFATSLWHALRTYGGLTERQLEAAQRCVAKDQERQEARQKAQENAPVVDTTKIAEAFASARGSAKKDGEGVKWLRLHLDTFKFSDAPANGQWAAAIFVKEGDRKLGRIVNGKFQRSFACDDATEARIITAASDPFTAAKVYGQRTGSCSCCGRELTNKVSREMGIGPICAEKFGW